MDRLLWRVVPVLALSLLGAGLGFPSPAGAGVLGPGSAVAGYVSDAADHLRSDPVYVDPQAEAATVVDAGALRAAIRGVSSHVVVAVLPAGATAEAAAKALPVQIGQAIGGRVTVAVLAGRQVQAASNDLPAGQADRLASNAVARHRGEGFTTPGVTGALTDFVRQVQAAPKLRAAGGAGGSSGSGALVALLIVFLVLVAGGLLSLVVVRRRRRRQQLAGLRADVTSLYDRLGSDVSTLNPAADPVARQALADASERYGATGALLARANTPAEYAAARRTAVEGLTAARVVRTKLGLDPGPEIAPERSGVEQLAAPQQVRIGESAYQGYPGYTPGSPYYYGGGTVGGRFVPGGWYGSPFWEAALLGGVLGGALGGGLGGGWGGGYGYDRGYEEGREDQGDNGGGGGDWGGGGGGDWGGGGGDWGGGGDSGGW